MKRTIFILSFLVLSTLLFLNFTTINDSHIKSNSNTDLEIPANVQQVIDNSCFGCHNLNSKNEKGKKHLSFDTLDTLAVAKLIGQLGEIVEVIEKDEMPPAKFLEFKPEAKLSDEQKELLVNWAESKGESLIE